MKRLYVIPEVEVIECQTVGMLCVSGNIGGDAAEPAHAREWSGDGLGYGDWALEVDE
jgi:hypothetical protein